MRETVAAGVRVVVVADNPEANRDAVECVGRVWFDVADGCGTRQAAASTRRTRWQRQGGRSTASEWWT